MLVSPHGGERIADTDQVPVLRTKLLHQIMCNLKQGVVWLRSANTIDALENRSRVEAGCKGRGFCNQLRVPFCQLKLTANPSPPTLKNQPFLPLAGLTFAGGPRFPAGPIRGPGGSPGSQGPITGEQHRDWPATVNPIHPSRGPGSRR